MLAWSWSVHPVRADNGSPLPPARIPPSLFVSSPPPPAIAPSGPPPQSTQVPHTACHAPAQALNDAVSEAVDSPSGQTIISVTATAELSDAQLKLVRRAEKILHLGSAVLDGALDKVPELK